MGAADTNARAGLPEVTSDRRTWAVPAAAPWSEAELKDGQPDAELLRLGAAAEALSATADALGVDMDALDAQVAAEAPPMPDVLLVTADDRAAWSFSADAWSPYNVELLREELDSLRRRAIATGTEGASWTLARAQDVIAAFDAWKGVTKARLAATRFPAVEEAYDEALEALGGLEEEILEQHATTVAGLQVKARLAVRAAGGRLETMDHDEAVLWSIVDDLLGPPSSAEVQS